MGVADAASLVHSCKCQQLIFERASGHRWDLSASVVLYKLTTDRGKGE